MNPSTDFTQELAALLAANVPLVHLVTYEEERVLQTLQAIDSARRLGIATWDIADGFTVVREGQQPLPTKECTTDTLLAHLQENAPPGWIFVLRDFHHSWNQRRPLVTRKLRNLAPRLRARSQFLIFTTPAAELPVELKDDVVVVHVPLPGEDELTSLFDDMTTQLDAETLPPPPVRSRLLSSALGLTTNQARLAFSRVLARYGRFDERGIDLVTWQKRQIIRESGALEFWPAEAGEDSVGGLDALKAWLKKRGLGFTPAAREAGVPYPRGVLLVGIPGTGKSLSAKMLSGLWKLPLVRLDVGALFGSLLGESEHNMRRAIALAEVVSPCILWVDELEKAFAGSTGVAGALSGGAATRVFGTFLTWMQEHHAPVFVLATANDVSGLPPELVGRFERTFFLDLPTADERQRILAIHLKKAGEAFPERRFRLDDLARECEGLVGRELEQIVREAQFSALADGNREIAPDDLKNARAEIVPLVKSHAEIVDDLRRWCREGRATRASAGEPGGC